MVRQYSKISFPFRRNQVSTNAKHFILTNQSIDYFKTFISLCFHLDDTGYSSQLLSGSLLSLRQSRESIDSQENEDDMENIKPTTSSSPIVEIKKSTNESVNLIHLLKLISNFFHLEK
jgi:hypothetical protein